MRLSNRQMVILIKGVLAFNDTHKDLGQQKSLDPCYISALGFTKEEFEACYKIAHDEYTQSKK